MRSITQYDLPKDATVDQVAEVVGQPLIHPEDIVKIVTYINGSPKTIRIICDHRKATQ